MLKPLRVFATLVVLVGAVTVAACEFASPGIVRFIVRVDSITLPDSIKPTDTLTIRFWGVVTFEGCAKITEVQKLRGAGVVQITLWATEDERSICVPSLLLLNRVDTLQPPLSDPLIVRVVRNNGAPIEKTVIVR